MTPHSGRGIWQEVDGMLARPPPRFDGAQPRIGDICERDAHRAEILKMIGRQNEQ